MRSLSHSPPSMKRALCLCGLILFVTFLKVADASCLRSEGPGPNGAAHLKPEVLWEIWPCF